jgi:hypothetical protein
MTKHPLTITQIKKLVRRYTLNMESGEYSFGEDTVRAAADWQLDQVIKYLEDDLPFVFWSNHFTVRIYMDKFKKAMRPQQQEND